MSKETFQVSQESVSDESAQSANLLLRVFRWIEVDGTQGLSKSQLFLYNYDLKPVEAKRRTWKWWNLANYWITSAFNINAWQIASTGMVAGLPWWVAWITVWLGYMGVGVFVALGGRVGVFYHISFPVACRSPFGIYGSLWPILNRVVMACIWFGVQSTLGGRCVELILRAIFGNDLEDRIPNRLNGTISSYGLLCFFIFWLVQLPFIYTRPHQIRHLFTAKAILCPIAMVAFLIWALVRAGGTGPVIHQHTSIHGTAYFWAFIRSTMNAFGNFATLVVNAPDFTRMATHKNCRWWPQTLTIPLGFGITCLIGVLVTSAGQVLYGTISWNPLQVLGNFLEGNHPGARAGVFFISVGFALGQLGMNIAANSLSAGTDMTALMPKVMNIRRGGFLCAAIGFASCPWNMLSSSSRFTTYLSAYAVFLSSIAGVLFCDYYILRKGNLALKELYIADKSSRYFYTWGINLRAYAAYICGILPNIVGFAGAVGAKVPVGATDLYRFNFFAGYLAATAVLLLVNLVWPADGIVDDIFSRRWDGQMQDVEDFDEFFASQIKR